MATPAPATARRGLDTSMGGSRSRFPSTSLSRLFPSGGDPDTRLRDQLVRVATAYWKPIYLYIRRVWQKSDADAKDLTQAFLVHLVEHDVIARFDRGLGNFRPYLKRCLQRFLGNEARDGARQKRGGGRPPLPIDANVQVQLPPSGETAEEQFDRDWAVQTIDACLREVEEHFRSKGRELPFQVFRAIALDAAPEEDASYRDVAARFGLNESAVRNHLRVVRQELRARLLRAASEYVVSEEDIFREMAEILGRLK